MFIFMSEYQENGFPDCLNISFQLRGVRRSFEDVCDAFQVPPKIIFLWLLPYSAAQAYTGSFPGDYT